MAGAPDRRRLHPAMRLVALQGALVVVLLLGELAARWFAAPPAALVRLPDPELWVATADDDIALRPSWSGEGAAVAGAPVRVRTNSLAMRDREFAGKVAGERRLLLLGDEVVFGAGVPVELALPTQLQQALADRGEAWTVGNGGVPRYGSQHAARQFERLDGGFMPDAIVCCGNLGDDTRDDQEPPRTVYAGWLLRGPQVAAVQASWRMRLSCRSALARWVERLWSGDDGSFAQVPVGLPELGERAFGGLFLDVGDGDPAWGGRAPDRAPWLAPLRAALRTLRERADRRPLLFVVVPTRWHLGEGDRLATLRRLGFRPLDAARGAGQQRWLDVAAELGVAAVDATPALAAEPDPAGLFTADGLTLSARGHAALARWLAGAFAESLPR